MNFPLEQWRLLITPPSIGAWNMAVDEAILEGIAITQEKPCLRLYAWEPPCLSIGYAQKVADIDRARISSLGWDWVRRPTGGRAILHTDELTYSIIAPTKNPRLLGGVVESYQRLSSALLAALHSLNIPALSLLNKSSTNHHEIGAVCFEVPSNYEITVSGMKLVGSAQARRKNVVLQHGTFPLWGDLARITQGLAYPDEGSRTASQERLLLHATTAERILMKKVSWQEAADAFILGFQTELNLDFLHVSLSAMEISRTEQLIQEKYTHPSWLERI